ncbi:MAG: hypothetical protein O2904_00925 [bacterium]|nr:hypothetical protein [bacterium]
MPSVNSNVQEDQEVDASQLGKITELKRTRESVIGEVIRYNKRTFYELGGVSEHESASLMEPLMELRGVNFDELDARELEKAKQDIKMWEQFARGIMKTLQSSVEKAAVTLQSMLATAVAEGSISERSKDGWIRRFQSPSISFESKEKFVDVDLKERLKNAKVIATKRKEMLKHADCKNLSSTQVKNVATFKDDKKFLELHFGERESLVLQVRAALDSHKLMPALYEKANRMISSAVNKGAMSERKVGKWLSSLFSNYTRTPKEIEGILKGELPLYIEKWKSVRKEYNSVMEQMDKHGVPQGFKRYEAEEFLDLDYFKRESYVREAKYALRMSVNGQGDRPIDGLMLDVRMEISQKQWNNAQKALTQAWRLAEGDDKYELASMQDYIDQFATEEKADDPNQSALEVVEGMREMLAEVPSSVRQLYIDALYMGPKTFKGLYSETYNLIWCYEHGYLNKSKDEELYQASFKETEEIVENGHWENGLENINLSAVPDGKKDSAMRPYVKTQAPTLIHLDANDGGARASFLGRCGENRQRNYWETVKLRNISYDKQQYLVYNVNWKLRSGIEKLYSMGHAFSLNGAPPSIN